MNKPNENVNQPLSLVVATKSMFQLCSTGDIIGRVKVIYIGILYILWYYKYKMTMLKTVMSKYCISCTSPKTGLFASYNFYGLKIWRLFCQKPYLWLLFHVYALLNLLEKWLDVFSMHLLNVVYTFINKHNRMRNNWNKLVLFSCWSCQIRRCQVIKNQYRPV